AMFTLAGAHSPSMAEHLIISSAHCLTRFRRTLLRARDEGWRIDVQQVQVIWARLLSPAITQRITLVPQIGESRRLYRRGRATPLEVDTGSYTNLYDLNRVGRHWLVSRVAALDDATAARLAAAPPANY